VVTVDATHGSGRASSPRWLLRVPAEESAGRIFCFPYSGVGASMFSRWPRWIGRLEVCPVQLPGRENRMREPHYGTYQALADSALAGLLPFLDRPFVFFGHCAGALPAFETARRLGIGASLRRLVVSAQVAPHDCPHDRFLDCTDEQLLDELRHLTVARGGEVHPAWLQLALDVLRRDLDANRVYWLDEPVRTPLDITVLHWSDDPEVTCEQLAGWAPYGRNVALTVLDGGHYDFLRAPGALLEQLRGMFEDGVRR
jgi:surfactin synthase thioesterase subunit